MAVDMFTKCVKQIESTKYMYMNLKNNTLLMQHDHALKFFHNQQFASINRTVGNLLSRSDNNLADSLTMPVTRP